MIRLLHVAWRIIMRMRIDEARGDDLTPGVDFFLARFGHLADRNDFSSFDRDVRLERIAARAVDHRAAADDEVNHDQNPNLSAMP